MSVVNQDIIRDFDVIQSLDHQKQLEPEKDEIDLLFQIIKKLKHHQDQKKVDQQNYILQLLKKNQDDFASPSCLTTNNHNKKNITSFWVEMANQIGVFLSVVTGFIVAHSWNYAIQSTIDRYQIDKDDPFLSWVYAFIMFFVAIFIMTAWGYLASRQIYLKVNNHIPGNH